MTQAPLTRAALLLALLAAPALAAPALDNEHRGGTLRLLASTAAGSIDPQINYTAQFWQIFAATYDGLVSFKKVPGPDGNTVVPDLADNLPEPENGLIYRFHLRPGLHFSDGAPVRPEDVVASFRRLFKVGSPTGETYYGAIEGADACLKTPDTCELPGVHAEADTIIITLTRPDPEFLQKLALPHAAILPASAPPHDSGTVPLPGTGPWRITRYDPNQSLILDRNPHFRLWSNDAQPEALPDGVDYEFGLDAEAQITSVLNGQADWMFDTPPPDRLGELAEHPAELHIDPADALTFVPLNVNLPPFNDRRARQAFSMAIDRDAIVRLMGGSRMAVPLCQIVPPGMPGYVPYCPFPHDQAASRRLVAESGTAGQPVTLVTDDGAVSREIGTYLVQVLNDIGYRARLQSLSANVQFSYIQNSNNHVQASLTSWYADYPSAATIIQGNFGCAAFRPGSDNSTNIPGFCDKALDKQLEGGTPADITAIDRAITDQAPAIVLVSPRFIDVLAPRVHGYQYHETFRWLMQRASVQ